MPTYRADKKTYLDFFDEHVEQRPDDGFLGSRRKIKADDGSITFGEYQWKSYKETQQVVHSIARGINTLQLYNEAEGDGLNWKFVGIWSRNRWEWMATYMANMHFNYTTVGFFDSMGPQTVDYICNQTELKTLCGEVGYVDKIVDMKQNNLVKDLLNFVCFDDITEQQKEKLAKVGVKLWSLDDVIAAGKDLDIPFQKQTENDYPLFSYTSGTTGDSKGVKLTHKNLVTSCTPFTSLFILQKEDCFISYLPYPHSFEQAMTYWAIMRGFKIGYYAGNPATLVADCQVLKPAFFPSVPRLFNRIYAAVCDKLKALSGPEALDIIIQKKIAAMLGGQVRYMLTASAPIDPNVLQTLRTVFCCPVVEVYGLTECAGGVTN